MPLFYQLIFPKPSRCLWADWFGDFEKVNSQLLISSDTPQNVRDSLLLLLAKAEKRNDEFWEGRKGWPKIIYTHSSAQHARYAMPSAPATTFYTPFGVSIVIAHRGLNLDVISHELCHAVLYHQLGWWRRESQIPTWFDEGLAMQVDYRQDYGENAYIQLLDSLNYFPDIKSITSPKLFWEEGEAKSKQHYIMAKHEVAHWLKENGKERLFRMMDRLVEDDNFSDIYYDSQ